MLLCDTNIWLALALSGHVHHRASRAWLDTINAPGVIHFCRATQQSLLRLLTNRTVLGAYGSPPLTNREAWAAYAAFLDDDRIVLAGANLMVWRPSGEPSPFASRRRPRFGWMPT